MVDTGLFQTVMDAAPVVTAFLCRVMIVLHIKRANTKHVTTYDNRKPSTAVNLSWLQYRSVAMKTVSLTITWYV